MYRVFAKGRQGFDEYTKEMGRMIAETIMYIESKEIAGPELPAHQP